MPSSTTDAQIAVAVAVAVAVGSSGAVLGRARRDLDAVKAAVGKARQTTRDALVAFIAVGVVVALIVNWWIRAKH